jgi:hypothetical protein
VRAVRLLAAIALFAGLGLTAFDDLIAVTRGTGHGNKDHGHLLSMVASPWPTFQCKYRSETRPSHRPSCRGQFLSLYAMLSLRGADVLCYAHRTNFVIMDSVDGVTHL